MHHEIVSKEAVKSVLRDYWVQYKAYSWKTILVFLLPGIGSVFTLFVPPLIMGNLIDIFIANGTISLTGVGVYIGLFGGLWLLGEIFWRAGFHFLIRLETQGIKNLGRTAFRRLADRDYDFYANHFIGSLTKKAMAFSRNFEVFTDTLVFNLTSNLFPVIFVVIVLWFYSPWIPIVLVACLVICVAVVLPIIRRRAVLVALRHEASSKMAGRLSDALTNMMAIKSFAKENVEYDTYGKYVEEYAARYKKSGDYFNLNLSSTLSPLYVGTNVIGLILVIFLGEKLSLQPGALLVVFSYYALVTRSLWEVNRIYREVESSVTEAAEFTEMFINPSSVGDNEHAEKLSVQAAAISFNDASFHYSVLKENEDSFLNNFNLQIKSKEKIGLVGPSGGGKTTITKLLLRFIDLQSGTITIDGQDISMVTQTSLRENLAYVPQDPLLFHRSLFENIAYGKDGATEEDVIEAAKLAHAHDFIMESPLGYQTVVGERGIKLSGGQRQRIAIARAILKNAPILLLDEATSSLDSESEKYIQEGLWELMKDKTALVIAHRLSTIKHLDKIIVLDAGKITEEGTHNELIQKKGLYAKLWSHQSGEFMDSFGA